MFFKVTARSQSNAFDDYVNFVFIGPRKRQLEFISVQVAVVLAEVYPAYVMQVHDIAVVYPKKIERQLAFVMLHCLKS